MKRKRHTPEQIISKLRQAQADLAAGVGEAGPLTALTATTGIATSD